jgi:hypothetical protein
MSVRPSACTHLGEALEALEDGRLVERTEGEVVDHVRQVRHGLCFFYLFMGVVVRFQQGRAQESWRMEELSP